MQFRKLLCLLAISTLIISWLSLTPIFDVKADPAPTLALSESSGKVDETISVNGTIDTENGNYQILFDDLPVANGTADGKEVKTEFKVPSLPAGRYTVKLLDVNASTESPPVEFTIETAYALDVYEPEKPHQFLEGDNVTISITIKGGKNSTTYSLNLTVTLYNDTSYAIIELSTDEYGYISQNVTYPVGFIGEIGTNYTGTYTVKLNETLAETNFTIGITELTEYHRNDTVRIYAVGYQPNENVTISIKFPDERIKDINVTADSSGVIEYNNWTVPMSAPMGNYSIQINSTKKYQDSQNFTVPGFAVNITAVNLSEKPVSSVDLEIFENETKIYSETTTKEGRISVKLERGNYTWKATYKEKLVGEGNYTISGEENITLQVSLSTLNVTIIDEKTGTRVPFAQIEIFCEYITVNDESRNLTLTKETDINGTALFENIFINVSYIIEARKYNALFGNTTYKTALPEQRIYNLTVTYPAKTLVAKVLNWANEPVEGLTVEAYEWTSGTATPSDKGQTDFNGIVTLNLTFGWYRLRILNSSILVNETKVELTAPERSISATIKCKLLDLNLTVRVLDFFGVPIPNIKIKLVMDGFSCEKFGNGEFFFNGLVGGEYRVFVFLHQGDTPYLAGAFYLNKPGTVITLRDESHVNFFGTLIGTQTFAMIITIIVIITVFIAAFIYRRLARKWIGKEKV